MQTLKLWKDPGDFVLVNSDDAVTLELFRSKGYTLEEEPKIKTPDLSKTARPKGKAARR